MKGAKAYILKEKFASFKMEDESVPEMFHRLQVLVNELKGLGEEVKDKDFSHKSLRSLPLRFGTLVTILVSGLDTMTPNQVLRDVMNILDLIGWCAPHASGPHISRPTLRRP